MLWRDRDDVEQLLLRHKELRANAQRARRRVRQLQEGLGDGALSRRIRTALVLRASNLERQQDRLTRMRGVGVGHD